MDVAKIIYPFYLKKNAEGAAENLVREAFKIWKRDEDVIDDITCIVIFLDIKWEENNNNIWVHTTYNTLYIIIKL